MEQVSSREQRRAVLTDAVMSIVDERGLDQVSVREVAAAAGVSIGTVQHYFPTKDEMLVAAYVRVVGRIRARLKALPLGTGVRANITSVLHELLPLDPRRRTEARVYLAFAAAAATSPSLSRIQQAMLAELHTELTEAFTRAVPRRSRNRSALAAHAVIAAADGLSLHAVTTEGWLADRQLTAAIDMVVTALVTG